MAVLIIVLHFALWRGAHRPPSPVLAILLSSLYMGPGVFRAIWEAGKQNQHLWAISLSLSVLPLLPYFNVPQKTTHRGDRESLHCTYAAIPDTAVEQVVTASLDKEAELYRLTIKHWARKAFAARLLIVASQHTTYRSEAYYRTSGQDTHDRQNSTHIIATKV